MEGTNFYHESGETLEQVAQRGSRCPIPGTIQGQVGQSSEKPDLVKDVPAYCRGIGQMTFKGPFQPKLFYDSTNETFSHKDLSASLNFTLLHCYQPVVEPSQYFIHHRKAEIC